MKRAYQNKIITSIIIVGVILSELCCIPADDAGIVIVLIVLLLVEVVICWLITPLLFGLLKIFLSQKVSPKIKKMLIQLVIIPYFNLRSFFHLT